MQPSRRSLFSGLVAACGGATGEAEAAPSPAMPGPRWAMVVDAARGIGCRACTVSGIMDSAVPDGSLDTIVSTDEVQEGDRAAMVMPPRLCNDCAGRPCIPVGATWQQPDGIMVVNGDSCVDCAYCVQACPYEFASRRTAEGA